MNSEGLQTLLQAVARGEVAPDLALDKIEEIGYTAVGEFAKIDQQRRERTGFP
ncbi:1-(5-phosphoribosyl)-5-amino-4-imidazole-carboxylate carboxylase, partial [Geitlerinema sp. P-1104]|nr:1-(5-phosphoribosyl)-5-amino-4-imidazole-carboxylate carboxylase [Geitlerinema sp. P-1104]